MSHGPFERQPPQSIEAERSVLGAMLLSSDAVDTAMDILGEDSNAIFALPAHRCVYDAYLALHKNRISIDPTTLVETMQSQGTLEMSGGVSYLSELSGAVPTSANVEYYADIALQTSLLRRIQDVCQRAHTASYANGADPKQVVDTLSSALFKITESRSRAKAVRLGDCVNEILDDLQSISCEEEFKSGLLGLDGIVGSFRPGELIILAARTSVGKTALALQIATNMVRDSDIPVLFFSMEMSASQLSQRVLSNASGVKLNFIRDADVGEDDMVRLVDEGKRLDKHQMWIVNRSRLPILSIRNIARRHVMQHGPGLVVVDYLQLVDGPKNLERRLEVAEVSRSLKELGEELEVPVLALSQLNREAEGARSAHDMMSRNRESGSIEQDADIDMVLYRPLPREIKAAEAEGVQLSTNVLMLGVPKNRNGQTGSTMLHFKKSVQRFYPVSKEAIPNGMKPREQKAAGPALPPTQEGPPSFQTREEDRRRAEEEYQLQQEKDQEELLF